MIPTLNLVDLLVLSYIISNKGPKSKHVRCHQKWETEENGHFRLKFGIKGFFLQVGHLVLQWTYSRMDNDPLLKYCPTTQASLTGKVLDCTNKVSQVDNFTPTQYMIKLSTTIYLVYEMRSYNYYAYNTNDITKSNNGHNFTQSQHIVLK